MKAPAGQVIYVVEISCPVELMLLNWPLPHDLKYSACVRNAHWIMSRKLAGLDMTALFSVPTVIFKAFTLTGKVVSTAQLFPQLLSSVISKPGLHCLVYDQ